MSKATAMQKTKSVQAYVPETLAAWYVAQSRNTGLSQSQYLERLMLDHAKLHGYTEPLPFNPNDTQELANTLAKTNPGAAAALMAQLAQALGTARGVFSIIC